MQRIHLKFLLIILFLTASRVFPQMVAPYADYTDLASYGDDSLYFFTSENNSKFLIADTASFNPDSVVWEEFVPGIGYQRMSYSDIKLFVTPSSQAKGYKLTLYENGNDTSQRCWVATYTFNCEILEKVNGDTLGTGAYSDCKQYGPIRVSITYDTVFYYNCLTLAKLFYIPKLSKPKWYKELGDPNQGRVAEKGMVGGKYKYTIEDAFWQDMWYWVEVTDSMGIMQDDRVFVRSTQPEAKFTANYIALDDTQNYPDKDTAYYFFYGETKSGYVAKSAPAYYMFISERRNAHEYKWDFGDNTTYTTTSDSVLKIYNYWKKESYAVKLTAIHTVEWSGKQCIDTTSNTEEVIVEQPVLNAPNAFSVNSSDYPAWRFYDVSITDFEISIFSRYGLRVHHFKGNIRDWDGWDGHINNSNNYASTGVYYYVVKDATGITNIDPNVINEDSWPKTNTDPGTTPTTSNKESDSGLIDLGPPNDEYRGFFHLFNSEE